MHHHDTPSACSCRLPPDCWGQAGFHYRRPQVADFLAREMREAARTDPSLARLLTNERRLDVAGAERLARERERIRHDFEGPAAAAAGRPEAYERCPEYRAAIVRSINRRKGAARSGDEDIL